MHSLADAYKSLASGSHARANAAASNPVFSRKFCVSRHLKQIVRVAIGEDSYLRFVGATEASMVFSAVSIEL